MKKRIVICCDGTWNEPEKIDNDRIVPTNVLKMVRAILPRDADSGIEQVVFYDKGIGSDALGKLGRSFAGATGYGISNNIRECYNFLANNYVDGDDIYLFGFSRGAYTARSLSGMLAVIGLLNKEDLRFVPQAYDHYHNYTQTERRGSPHAALMQSLPVVMPRIKFLGVWDTVGAIGAPTPVIGKLQALLGKVWKRARVGFHNCALSPIVENAYQALAIDERRGPFRPAVWDARQQQSVVQQVWFAGVHSNIGGGYADAGLADVAMQWMVNRAFETGLVFNAHYLAARLRPDGMSKLEDSFKWGYKLLSALGVKPFVREIGCYADAGEMIHESVIQRIRDPHAGYRPRNLLGDGELWLEKLDERAVVVCQGRQVQIYRERGQLRRSIDNINAIVNFDKQVTTQCKVIDFTRERGARLTVDVPVAPGDRGKLECVLTGNKTFSVVWYQRGEIGIRFVS